MIYRESIGDLVKEYEGSVSEITELLRITDPDEQPPELTIEVKLPGVTLQEINKLLNAMKREAEKGANNPT